MSLILDIMALNQVFRTCSGTDGFQDAILSGRRGCEGGEQVGGVPPDALLVQVSRRTANHALDTPQLATLPTLQLPWT